MDDGVLLGEARAWLRARVRKGAECPCCRQHAKVYRRALGSSMAAFLCLSLRHFGDRWFSVPDDLAPKLVGKSRNLLNGGDYAKLVWWKLVEQDEAGRRSDGSPRTGFFRVTESGAQFARGSIEVPSHALVYNGELLKLDGDKHVRIYEALRKRFDYDALMRG